MTGDVTNPSTSLVTTISAAAVTLPKMANLAANSVIANLTGSAAVPAAVPLSALSAVSSVVARDANANTQTSNARQGFTTTATAAGTTTLAAASTYLQFFTGTLAQTVTLPDVTTLVLGHQFYIRNNSTGLVTINSSGGNLIRIVGPDTRCMVTCKAITGTTAASWSSMYLGVSIADGKVLAVQNNLTLSGTDGTSFAFPTISGTVSLNTAVDNVQSGATYSLALSDANAELSLTNATSCAVSIPLNATVAFPIGARIPIWADAAGTYTIVGVSGVTLNGISGGTRTGTMNVNTSGVRNSVVLRKIGTDTWTVSGAVGAVA